MFGTLLIRSGGLSLLYRGLCGRRRRLLCWGAHRLVGARTLTPHPLALVRLPPPLLFSPLLSSPHLPSLLLASPLDPSPSLAPLVSSRPIALRRHASLSGFTNEFITDWSHHAHASVCAPPKTSTLPKPLSLFQNERALPRPPRPSIFQSFLHLFVPSVGGPTCDGSQKHSRDYLRTRVRSALGQGMQSKADNWQQETRSIPPSDVEAPMHTSFGLLTEGSSRSTSFADAAVYSCSRSCPSRRGPLRFSRFLVLPDFPSRRNARRFAQFFGPADPNAGAVSVSAGTFGGR